MGTVDREVKLRSAAQSLRRSGVVIVVLLAIGSVVIGVGASRHQTCTTTTISGYALPSCTTQTDVGEAMFTTAAIFLSGFLLYYPLYFHLSRPQRGSRRPARRSRRRGLPPATALGVEGRSGASVGPGLATARRGPRCAP